MILIVFIVSFVALVVLFLQKHRELKTGQKSFVGMVLSNFDQFFIKFIQIIHYRVYQIIQSVRYIILVRIPEKGRIKIEKTKETVINEYQKQKSVIMGKKNIPQKGSSSFFLRKMIESKSVNGGGKIDDETINNIV